MSSVRSTPQQPADGLGSCLEGIVAARGSAAVRIGVPLIRHDAGAGRAPAPERLGPIPAGRVAPFRGRTERLDLCGRVGPAGLRRSAGRGAGNEGQHQGRDQGDELDLHDTHSCVLADVVLVLKPAGGWVQRSPNANLDQIKKVRTALFEYDP